MTTPLMDAVHAAVERSQQVYDLSLELSSLLHDMASLEPPVPLSFSLARYSERVTALADPLYVDLLRIRDAMANQQGGAE